MIVVCVFLGFGWVVSMLMLGLSGCITSTSSLHLRWHQSIILSFYSISTHHSTPHQLNCTHSQPHSLTHSDQQLKNNIQSLSYFFFLCNWDNLRRQSHPHFHPFSSSATPHFNLQVLVFVFHKWCPNSGWLLFFFFSFILIKCLFLFSGGSRQT